MRVVVLAVLLAASGARAQAVRFVAPLEGAQAVGPMLIEIATDVPRADRVEFFVDGALAGVVREPPYRIYFDFGTSMAARTVSAKVWWDGYASSTTAEVRTAALTANERIDVDLVEVPIRVRSTRKLAPGDFRVRENGVEQTVRDVRMERPPAHFAFVIDRSLSMSGGKLEAALLAVRSGLAQLREGDSASIVLFNHNVSKAQPIARSGEFPQQLAAIVPSGGTSLRDSLASVASPERVYAIAITDGGDRNSLLSEETALRRISGTKTIVSALVLGGSRARFLERAARNTGGSVAQATKDSLRGALANLIADINSRHLLIYQSHGTKRGWRTIDIKPRRRDIAIQSARKGYFAEP